jgi:hypothetical protein
VGLLRVVGVSEVWMKRGEEEVKGRRGVKEMRKVESI